ncbi:MAG: molybdenum ABC transporter ATP-binding protein [Puniceicoccales bacterium]|jgi:molybdate transport system ATP-binding protein|nr:molybdenum ABC transporter ATP-binding protein [Puniceicoccales bacterium]
MSNAAPQQSPATTGATTGGGEIRARLRVERKQFALDVDVSLPGRGVTALFGASGSGKTTFLRAVAGLEPSVAGELRVNGETWLDSASGTRLPVHRRRIGYVFQEPSLFPHLTVRQNLEYGRRRRTVRAATTAEPAQPTPEQLCALLGIEHLLDRSPATLSGGERQRVAIARALLAAPRLLLMDEPMSSLDQRRKEEFMPFLEKLRDALQIPVLYVTHAAGEARRLATHVVLLDAGRVTAAGAPSDLLKEGERQVHASSRTAYTEASSDQRSSLR